MTYLVLKSDGQVTLLRNDGSVCDVSDNAGEYLFQEVLLVEGLLLRDIFRVLERNPLLLQVFRVLHAEALVKQVLSEGAPKAPEYGPEEIEYLELSRYCFVDHRERSYRSTQFLTLTGIGFPLIEPLETEMQVLPVGYRQRWSVSMTPVRDLANYPVRFNEEVEIQSPAVSTTDAGPQTGLSGNVKFGPPTLGQVIHGVLHELTFFGMGEAREEFHELIEEEQVAGDWKEISTDDLIAHLDEMIRRAEEHEQNQGYLPQSSK